MSANLEVHLYGRSGDKQSKSSKSVTFLGEDNKLNLICLALSAELARVVLHTPKYTLKVLE